MLTFERKVFVVPLLIAGLGSVSCASSGGSTSGQPAPGAMPDGSIAGVVNAANDSEIELGRIAASKSTNAQVRAFGQRMVSDHTHAEQQFRNVLTQANISTSTSTTATQIDQNSQATAETLNALEGAKFDRTYIDGQVSQHEWLLRTLDETMIPSAQNNNVEIQLRAYRTMIAEHLDEARRIRQGL